jgi:succinate dehydrogenase / fumarate reductase flavoprotein subunit
MHIEKIETGVLIIGAGAAGLRTAIELAGNDIDCLVIGKRKHGDAHTIWAAGGINASLGNLDKEDRWQIHAADTVKEGHFICHPKAVELLARHAPTRVLELQRWGCDFNLSPEGKINQRYFGAQSYRRTCFVGDRTGEAMLHALVAKAKALGIAHRQNLYITTLLVSGGGVVGALGTSKEGEGHVVAIGASAVVLAAGGHTALYTRSSSRKNENTGDAAALAYEAGAQLRDMEFVQFHPTGMVKPEDMSGRLVTEAVRGEGGQLLNRDGERFMTRYSPERMELDARDVVARAIYRELKEGRGTESGAVLLDISHRDRSFIRERLPEMLEQFKTLGVDITEEAMEVAPTAHYAMGGVKVDFKTGATGVEGLFAVGEATGGLHGANRLGGNSLAETVVFGQLTGAHLAGSLKGAPARPLDESLLREPLASLAALTGEGKHDPDDVIDELRELLWHHAGISRSEGELQRGLAGLADIAKKASSLSFEPGLCGPGFEAAMNLKFMLLVGESILRGALMRKESRGAHYREDAPERDPRWQKTIVYANRDGEMALWTEEVGEIHPEVQKAVDEEHSLAYHHLE